MLEFNYTLFALPCENNFTPLNSFNSERDFWRV